MDREQAQELFSAYREGELPAEQLEAFECLLEDDEETREDYEQFCRTLETLSFLTPQAAPDDFVEKLQKKMRRRSGGRLFGANRWGHVTRVPYELFSLILILIILSVYLLTMPVLRVPAQGGTSSQSDSPGQREQ